MPCIHCHLDSIPIQQISILSYVSNHILENARKYLKPSISKVELAAGAIIGPNSYPLAHSSPLTCELTALPLKTGGCFASDLGSANDLLWLIESRKERAG